MFLTTLYLRYWLTLQGNTLKSPFGPFGKQNLAWYAQVSRLSGIFASISGPTPCLQLHQRWALQAPTRTPILIRARAAGQVAAVHAQRQIKITSHTTSWMSGVWSARALNLVQMATPPTLIRQRYRLWVWDIGWQFCFLSDLVYY